MQVHQEYSFGEIRLKLLQTQQPQEGDLIYTFQVDGVDFLSQESFNVQVIDGVLRHRTGSHIRSCWGDFGPTQDFEHGLKDLLKKKVEQQLSNILEEASILKQIFESMG